jgi:hypothetical protein
LLEIKNGIDKNSLTVKFGTSEGTILYNKIGYNSPFEYNPKCLVFYIGPNPNFNPNDKSENNMKKKSKFYIYTPYLFNKILTTKKNSDGSDVPEEVLGRIRNTIDNLSKMGVSLENIISGPSAFTYYLTSIDEITNEDTNYHFITIIRIMQRYGIDIRKLTRISSNKMVDILYKLNLLQSPADQFFFRNLNITPLNSKIDATIEDELDQQRATFCTYLYYVLITADQRYISIIMNELNSVELN